MIKYKITFLKERYILIDKGNDEFISFPAQIENPSYESFLESQQLTHKDIEEMETDVWNSIN